MSKPLTFSGIAERLGKLIPRLASDHPGEVASTAAAIGRTLASAGLDWHDLTARLTGQTVEDLLAAAAGRHPSPEHGFSAPDPAGPRNPGHAPRESDRGRRQARQEASQPRREPSPWPTWGTLSHFGRLDIFAAILGEAALLPEERERLAAAHEVYRRHQIPLGGKDQRTFNVACRNLWERGWRPEVVA